VVPEAVGEGTRVLGIVVLRSNSGREFQRHDIIEVMNPQPELPMAIQLKLADRTERMLKEKAARSGLTLEAYVARIVEREALSNDPETGQTPKDLNDLERGLDELLEDMPSVPTLPADFSRTDIYSEHA
jgi:hypothetical protein